MKTSLIIKIVVLTTVFAPQLVNAFVWENNDEKRQEWKSLVGTTFLGECGSDPSELCLKNSSLMQLTKDVCGRAPPGVSEADHRDIFRELCVGDATFAVNGAIAEVEVSKKIDASNAKQNEWALKEIERRNIQTELDNQKYQEQVKKEEKDELAMKAVRKRDLEIQRESEEKRDLIERTGMKGLLVDLFVALSLVLAFLIVNYEAMLLKIRGVGND